MLSFKPRVDKVQQTNLLKNENPTQIKQKFHTWFAISSNQKWLKTTQSQNVWDDENFMKHMPKKKKKKTQLNMKIFRDSSTREGSI